MRVARPRHVLPAVQGSKNGRAKLTEQDVAEIREDAANGVAAKVIHRRFRSKVSYRQLSKIVSGGAWKHVAKEGR